MTISNDSLKVKKLKFYEFEDFNKISEEIDDYLSTVTSEILEYFPQDADIQSMNFILYELLINVYKHSKFKNAYCQVMTNNIQEIEVCICDDGIGIAKSFEDASIPSDDDCEAIFDAINGKTSDKEKYHLRGRGLNSTARLVAGGFDGKLLISSGKGVCEVTKKGAKTYFNDHDINGTSVVMKIRNRKVPNIYEYLKFEHINAIKEGKNG